LLSTTLAINKHSPVTHSVGRFSRQQRLIRPDQFKRVFTKPTRVSDSHFSILGQSNQKNSARLGLAIAKKYIKKAVGRNRIKRLVRESFRHHQELLAGVDIVVTCRGDASRLTNQDIQERLVQHWHNLVIKIK